MQLNPQLIDASTIRPARIVVCEPEDPRILSAAYHAQQLGIAAMTLVGNPEKIRETAASLSLDIRHLPIENPTTSNKRGRLVQALHAKRAHKGMTLEAARQFISDPLCFANMLVATGEVEGSVAGAVYCTADVVRSALQLIGKKKDTPIVSSFFLMLFHLAQHDEPIKAIFSDCGLVIEPTEEELAAIAIAAVDSAKMLLPVPPRVAMLSFSTGRSADHPCVTKVVNAAQRVKAALPDLAIDEDIQFDAAIVPEVAARKLKHSTVNGMANVFIFPNLEAGNIGYKIAERLGGAKAVGPIIQGLAKPANDLSRGCSPEDVLNVIAITSIQAQHLAHA